ncbi:hypothetical protein BJF79_35490 [Actinomadura sp. CNU-125]|nr:hypothetical protein BJF79_35490 [Actinomadura sp. CNU-125]
MVVQAVPASADEVVCGKWVRGAILEKYRSMGGQGSPLGCPTTEELTTPDGRGKYTHFQGGSIYWTSQTGAHPVWGVIRDKWASSGWEGGKLGYPVGDELTNPDQQGKRQEFEGGTFYWHPTRSNGAHAVLGRIGELWGQWGWEGGTFGYPTSDEMSGQKIGGILDSNTGVRQQFEGDRQLLWSPGQSNAYEVCHSECVGYVGYNLTDWVYKTEVYTNLGNGRRSVHVSPTEAGFQDAEDDFEEHWRQVWSNTPYLPNATQAEVNSVGKQLHCHAMYAYEIPGLGRLGGETWDLETWHSDVPWEYAIDPQDVFDHECNWE